MGFKPLPSPAPRNVSAPKPRAFFSPEEIRRATAAIASGDADTALGALETLTEPRDPFLVAAWDEMLAEGLRAPEDPLY